MPAGLFDSRAGLFRDAEPDVTDRLIDRRAGARLAPEPCYPRRPAPVADRVET
jgi:hypothetical protein